MLLSQLLLVSLLLVSALYRHPFSFACIAQEANLELYLM